MRSRRLDKTRMYSWLLVSALLLRSLIAPGFMLSLSAGGGLGIIFCDGPVTLSEKAGHHQHHDADLQTGDTILVSPICSQWSSSSVLAISTGLDLPGLELPHTGIEDRYLPPAIPATYYQKQIIRAPPVTHLSV